MLDPFNLQRFLDAQDVMFPLACQELAAGTKRSHWMWYVFPQIAGLGHSAMAQKYAISGRAEARAYLGHPELGAHLRDATGLVLRQAGRQLAEQIFGAVDAAKFRSSMTLFAAVSAEPCFNQALAAFYGGVPDPETLKRLD